MTFDREESFMDSEDFAPVHNSAKSKMLTLKLSATLFNKLGAKAQGEGVTLEELAMELVAEGLVLRAWEIMERKATMRGAVAVPNNNSHASSHNKPNQGRYSNNKGPHAHSNNTSNPRRKNFQNVMEDRASFVEYVRNQEKQKR